MKFLPYSKENDDNINSDIILCINSKREVQESDDWWISSSIESATSDINWLHDLYNEGSLQITTPPWFSRISKKEYFIAKCKFLHHLKYGELSVITNPMWHWKNSKLPWDERYIIEEDYTVSSYVATLREKYSSLCERSNLLERRKRQQRKLKRIAKKHRKQLSQKKLIALRENAYISAANRIYYASYLTEEIHQKATELKAKGVAMQNIASALANKYFHLSERQIRRHLLESGFRKRQNSRKIKTKIA